MGPLAGYKVIEIKGIGPGPYAGMLLADMGADVLVVERASTNQGLGIPSVDDVNSRGKRSIALNLKSEEGLAILLQLVSGADVLFEGFRPGVAERLGFGPDACLAVNPKLVYGRLTGWGQHGPLAKTAGHDINYISITGALAAIGGEKKPALPLNLIGDYAGGSLFLVMGVLAALLEAQASGQGQVVDAAITDGSASLMSVYHGWEKSGFWKLKRQSNLLDGGACFYNTYETADQKFVSIGPLEPQFLALFVKLAGLDPKIFNNQIGPDQWAELKPRLATAIRQKTQQQWCDIFAGTDACVAPVLDIKEAPKHPHNRARNTYISINGVEQPAPAPRFSRTPSGVPHGAHSEGADTETVLAQAGYQEPEIARLRALGVLT